MASLTRAGRDRLSGTFLIAMLVCAGYVMLADFVNLRSAREAGQTPIALDELDLPQPWGGYGWRALSRLAGDAARVDEKTAESVLVDASSRYPLDAVQWLDLARVQARTGSARQVDDYLARAGAVQPFERRSLWAAAQVALQTGNAALAERQLRQWLRLYPNDTGQALFIGSRWIDQPGTLLDRMVPEGRQYLAEAMDTARRQSDIPLAEAVWDRLTPKPGLDDPLFLNFVELLLETGAVSRAVNFWAEQDPDFESGKLINGDFARPPGEPLAFNWRVNRPPAGVRIQRDENQALVEPASLKVEFNGKENVHLGEPWIRIPVEPGRHYRLSGAWRAETLTTRSLPYWYLTGEGGDLRERVSTPSGNFDWTGWQIEFQVPEGVELIRLQLRRDRTDAFDRNIEGTLWLDDFRLEPIAAPQTLQSAISEALGWNTGSGLRGKATVDGLRGKATVNGLRFTVYAGEEEKPVSGFRFRVSGEEQPVGRGGIPDGEQPVGRGGIPDGRNPTGKQADRDDSLAGQAPTPVEGSAAAQSLQSGADASTGVGAGPAGDESGADAQSLAGQAPTPVEGSAAGRGLESGADRATDVGAGLAGDERGPEARIASASAETADPEPPARKPETGNRKPAPQALETRNPKPARSAR